MQYWLLRFASGSLSSSSQYKDKNVRKFWSEDVSIDLDSAIPIRYFQPITGLKSGTTFIPPYIGMPF